MFPYCSLVRDSLEGSFEVSSSPSHWGREELGLLLVEKSHSAPTDLRFVWNLSEERFAYGGKLRAIDPEAARCVCCCEWLAFLSNRLLRHFVQTESRVNCSKRKIMDIYSWPLANVSPRSQVRLVPRYRSKICPLSSFT